MAFVTKISTCTVGAQSAPTVQVEKFWGIKKCRKKKEKVVVDNNEIAEAPVAEATTEEAPAPQQRSGRMEKQMLSLLQKK